MKHHPVHLLRRQWAWHRSCEDRLIQTVDAQQEAGRKDSRVGRRAGQRDSRVGRRAGQRDRKVGRRAGQKDSRDDRKGSRTDGDEVNVARREQKDSRTGEMVPGRVPADLKDSVGMDLAPTRVGPAAQGRGSEREAAVPVGLERAEKAAPHERDLSRLE